MSESVKTHYRTCNLCEAMCGIEIKYQNKKIISIRGDEKDPFSRGHICPKAVALQDLYEDPNRLRHPVRRVGDKWEKISWEEAFDEVAKRLKDIQSRYGRSAVATYQGNPVVHNYGSLLFGPNFVRSLRTKNRFSATSVDQLPHHFSAYHMFGHQLMIPIPDIDRTDFFMIIGGNPAVSNGSLMSAPDVANRIKEIRKRGGKVVVVDPRRSETAAIADNHYFIKPGRDAYLLLALLNTIFSEKLENLGRVADFSENLSRVKEVVAAFTPESVEKVTGIAANDIRLLAREFALARSAICYGRMGVSVQEFGAVANWLILLMNIVTGNLDSPGGVMFTKPAFDIISTATSLGLKGNFGRWSSRVRKLPEFAGELPVSALAEEILTEGKDQVRALVTSAGNPVLSCPNGQQLDRALASLEFMVSIDIYINETTRHAHIILPPTSSLEHENYDVVFHALAIRNTAKYSPALFE
ncbi:MAG: molybdopterin-dependent oxidoreductase, partial [Blastocatellia bacterium]|nr:molybdopterin-dependent oxidoreductase [Blastocatellia bacterium]